MIQTKLWKHRNVSAIHLSAQNTSQKENKKWATYPDCQNPGNNLQAQTISQNCLKHSQVIKAYQNHF